ncbi:beta-propeller fold lactonase family protein [Tenacibaculum sp.]|uniref:beta-propeller fold lactonase family protein n=1 Tax=Tenacibaculum sp. TaxID=1906242 RepID=UPI003AA88544
MKLLKKGVLLMYIALQLISCSDDSSTIKSPAEIIDAILKGNVTSIGSQPDLVALSAFSFPSDVAVDQNGDIYVADTGDNSIKKITINTSGSYHITTIAGDGSSNSNDGVGTTASFQSPLTLTFSKDYKTLYVATQIKIRAININTNEVRTIAGNGSYGNTDGIGENAQFKHPSHITINTNGTVLYVLESENGIVSTGRIRKIDIANKQVTTLHLTNLPTTFYPQGIVIDSKDEHLYVANWRTILKINLQTNNATIIAGSDTESGTTNGIGEAARFTSAKSITFSPHETFLYIGSLGGNYGIRAINMRTLEVTTVIGNGYGFVNGGASTAQFKGPYKLNYDNVSNKLYVADPSNNAIRVVE